VDSEGVTSGIEETGIKAGIIGEIGTSAPMHPNEAQGAARRGARTTRNWRTAFNSPVRRQ